MNGLSLESLLINAGDCIYIRPNDGSDENQSLSSLKAKEREKLEMLVVDSLLQSVESSTGEGGLFCAENGFRGTLLLPAFKNV
eukprot:CAMPEP_0113307218 /NCGR_PEP_ID=MMETSP0010_2-20120614/6152_1 /TAXON_ID=216773 ORGANISM="Corethron hystrix, Strain 308" /NCGR_SAMPLE_ID=MMETSP0010_2 /ASSEMBLY_ACC=CAM_ASM_000155 /LENGTH=82 /DNA_ID=CAMNT_0000162031 /DNA_START=2037 /DNA_END=2285 /DNA_ORIENTATION=+ /assembly_acc=CAM_ASM_000155